MLWHGLPSERKRDIHEQVSIDAFFQMVKENQYKIQYRVMLSRYRGKTVCPLCHGTRLKEEATWVKIGGKSIADLVEMPIGNLRTWFEMLELSEHEAEISRRLLTEIKSRLGFLSEVGLNYLTLNRASNTLSGGESQRINLCTSLGSSLVGSLYILDEPRCVVGGHRTLCERLTGKDGQTDIVIWTSGDEFCRHALGCLHAIRLQVFGQHRCGNVHCQHDVDTLCGALVPRVACLGTCQHHHKQDEGEQSQQHGQMHHAHAPALRRLQISIGVAELNGGFALLPITYIPY